MPLFPSATLMASHNPFKDEHLFIDTLRNLVFIPFIYTLAAETFCAKPCIFWLWRYLNPPHIPAAENSNNFTTGTC
jgi:hypothetical protein